MTKEVSVSFFAYLDREDGTSHGACQHSPIFRSEPELVGWIRANRQALDEVHAIRREVDGAVVNDFPLDAYDEVKPDRARVIALIEELTAMIETKKRELDKKPTARPYSRVGEFNPIERPMTYEEAYPESAK